MANPPLTEPAVQRRKVWADPGVFAPSGESVFETKGVSIYYGSFRAVTDVSLTIHENEITAFIGPSGCGKTTVLRTLNRMNGLVVGARVEGDVRVPRGASLFAGGSLRSAVIRRLGRFVQPGSIPQPMAPPPLPPGACCRRRALSGRR